MGWVKARTTEMPAVLLPTDPRRRPQRLLLVGVSLVVLAIVATGALFGPSLLSWMSLSPPPAGPPLADGSATPALTDASPGAAAQPSPSDSPTRTTSAAPAGRTKAAPPPAKPHPAPAATPMPELENDVLSQTNEARVANGCAALKMNGALLTAARLHSADMAANNYFDHDSLDGRSPGARMSGAGYDTSRGWAENIAAGYPTADQVMAGWLGSQGHRANILNCAMKSIGIGVARAPNGRLYWTQDFGGR